MARTHHLHHLLRDCPGENRDALEFLAVVVSLHRVLFGALPREVAQEQAFDEIFQEQSQARTVVGLGELVLLVDSPKLPQVT
mgnify:CR=1 FL=1